MPIKDWDIYRKELRGRLDPTADSLELIFEQVQRNPRRVVFTEGEDDRIIRAAIQFKAGGYGTPILVGREDFIRERIKDLGLPADVAVEIQDAHTSRHNAKFSKNLYQRLHRKGYMERDCERMMRQNRNVFGASMVAAGDADALVTGLTRSFVVNYDDMHKVLDASAPSGAFGLSVAISQERTVILADTAVNVSPSPERLAEIATRAAAWAKRMGHEPRVAFLSFSSFGQPQRHQENTTHETLRLLDGKKLAFEYDGEMTADVALDYTLMKRLYPFCRLTGPANVLVMPTLQAAHIAAKLLENIGGVNLIGPIMDGFDKPVQIVRMGSTVSDLVTSAVLAAYQVGK